MLTPLVGNLASLVTPEMGTDEGTSNGISRTMTRKRLTKLLNLEISIFYFFSFLFWEGMHKKSTGMIRKLGNEEKLTGLWDSNHLQEGSSPRLAGSQRGSDEARPENGLEDVAIDLSSSARQGTKKAHQGNSALGCSDSSRLEGLLPGKVGA